ncbi:MAG: Mu-like prophage major head subunit gpT family protein [Reyranella sp.]|nr:Mu-like prophage major head subunit gpT family protein [Reyranella sp.]
MIRVSSGKLATINIGYRANFQAGQEAALADNHYERLVTPVPSTTRENEYGWLKDIPQIREWVGDRVVNALAEDGYRIKNKPFELTISVKADDINDDQHGIYAPRFRMMGDEVARFPNVLVFSLLKAGFATDCFDGQFYFDTDHPYTKADGTLGTQSNYQEGSATPWYLLCTKRPLRPLIWQEREKFDFVALDRPTDPNVFMKKELLYGVDGRANVGFGFWQMAVGSKATFDAANFKAARLLMENLLGEHGKPLNLTPDLFVGPKSLRDTADELFNTATLSGGGGNPLYKAVDTLYTNYLL